MYSIVRKIRKNQWIRYYSNTKENRIIEHSYYHGTLNSNVYNIPTFHITKYDTPESMEAFLQTKIIYNVSNKKYVPMILDVSKVSSDGTPHSQPINAKTLEKYINILRKNNIVPLGITNASQDIQKFASHLRLPCIMQANDSFTEIEELHISEPSRKEENVKQLKEPLIIESSVRTGQQLYATDSSLIIMGSVNSGAEVLADGDIYVFGHLKGRALAGVNGNKKSKIFSQKFDAELVAISDYFTTCDTLEEEKTGILVKAN